MRPTWLVLFFCAGLALSQTSIPALPAIGRTIPSRYDLFDGRWWTTAVDGEREGYVNGFQDCYRYDVKGARATEGWTIRDYVEAVDSYYQQHPSERRSSLLSVLSGINTQGPPRAVPKGGETWNEAHGYYDGTWWRGGDVREQLGFIEGYLSCHAHYVAGKTGVTFSKPPSEYRALIDTYMAGSSRRDDEKLASILSRFQDQPARKK